MLQLLREGVFNQPRHVLTEAMSVAMELLDLELLRMHRAPEALIESLAELGHLYGDGSTHRRGGKDGAQPHCGQMTATCLNSFTNWQHACFPGIST